MKAKMEEEELSPKNDFSQNSAFQINKRIQKQLQKQLTNASVSKLRNLEVISSASGLFPQRQISGVYQQRARGFSNCQQEADPRRDLSVPVPRRKERGQDREGTFENISQGPLGAERLCRE